MPRPRLDIPSYRKHSSGAARVTINGRDYLLGPHGTNASTTIHAQMKRIVRMMKWSAAEGRIPASVFETLRLIPGLKKGRNEAKETAPVKPVDHERVSATIEHLPCAVADRVRLQLLAGCRPGEVCRLTPAMIDREGEVWVATLSAHKTAHHGRRRNIYFGPQAQAILMPYLLRGPNRASSRTGPSDETFGNAIGGMSVAGWYSSRMRRRNSATDSAGPRSTPSPCTGR